MILWFSKIEREWDEREFGLSVEEFTKYLRINNAHHEQSLKDTNSMPQKKRTPNAIIARLEANGIFLNRSCNYDGIDLLSFIQSSMKYDNPILVEGSWIKG